MQTVFDAFIDGLAHDLQQPLPGPRAQFDMAPQPRAGALPGDRSATDSRRSGVLILFYPNRCDVYFPLILRPIYPGVHSGQIGLPGGGLEAGDFDLTATALRETYEEIGVPRQAIRVLGALSPLYIERSNQLVLPIVGWTDARPTFCPDPHEVAQLIEVRLLDFLDPTNRRTEVWELTDRRADVPIFGVQNQVIWGATAMILSELLALPAVRQLAESPLGAARA
jgi:8-oxo-dGTP pyrophosphatase MutT (NUDIX family)